MLLGNEEEVKKRLIKEEDDLSRLFVNLSAFMQSNDYDKLPLMEQNLMFLQKQCMSMYSNILNMRIGLIEKRIDKIQF